MNLDWGFHGSTKNVCHPTLNNIPLNSSSSSVAPVPLCFYLFEFLEFGCGRSSRHVHPWLKILLFCEEFNHLQCRGSFEQSRIDPSLEGKMSRSPTCECQVQIPNLDSEICNLISAVSTPLCLCASVVSLSGKRVSTRRG